MSSLAAAMVLATGLKLVASHPAYPEGAPSGFSGGFKEDSCRACHFNQDLNVTPGQVSIEGVPDRFDGGTRYSLTITLRRPEMKLAGFQLTARFKDGGAQAGTLTPAADDAARITIGVSGAIQYAGQNKSGATLGDGGVARWSVEWVAPASGGAVVFHVAANAADGNGSADGDFIYTSMIESAPAQQPRAPVAVEMSPAEQAFQKVTGVVLGGFFTLGEGTELHPDRYEITSVTKVKNRF